MMKKPEVPLKEKVGFIGLGKMGQRMAGRLLNAGFPLTVWNRTEAKTVDLAKRGAKVAKSPREVAAQSDIIITMVFDDAALEAVTFGENGILAGIRAPSIFIDMSTVGPEISSRVASEADKQGVKMLRSPVLGSTPWAEAGTLTILVSGDKKSAEKCQKILGVMGKKIHYLGPKEEARYLKVVYNMMVAMTSQMLAEALTFGKKAGLDWQQMLEVISDSNVASPTLCRRVARLAERDFTPGGTGACMAKDLDLALMAGQRLGSPMPAIGVIRQLLSVLKATGREDLDHIALVLVMEDLAVVK
ncbi:NAD(P)-dependent oxidoreductase [Chloroflexota bacterium]